MAVLVVIVEVVDVDGKHAMQAVGDTCQQGRKWCGSRRDGTKGDL